MQKYEIVSCMKSKKKKLPYFRRHIFLTFFRFLSESIQNKDEILRKYHKHLKLKKTKKRPSLPESDISLQLQNGDIVVKGPAEKKHCATNISAKYGENFGLIKVKVQLN